MSEKKTTTKKKPGRKPKADKTAAPVERDKVEERQAAATPAAGAETGNAPAPETGNASEPSPSAGGGSNETAEADNRNGGAVDESGAPDNGSGESGENPEQAAHAPDQNGDIPEQGEEGAAQAAPEAGDDGAAETGNAPAALESEEAKGGGDPEQAAPAAEGWTVARVLKITKPLMKGEDVKALQAALIARGYHCGASGASGIYERNTAYAVRCFQAANRLIVDGRAGRFTVAALGGTWNG